MKKNKTDLVSWMLLGTIVLLLLANLVLFIRMNQLQSVILSALKPVTPVTSLGIGTNAPDFTLMDLENQEVSLQKVLEDLGKPVFLVFSSVNCSACKEFWPTLKQFYDQHPDLQFIMISKGEISESAQMAKEQRFGFPILPWSDEVASSYSVPGTPYFFVISKDQIIVFSGFSVQLDEVENKLNQIVEDRD